MRLWRIAAETRKYGAADLSGAGAASQTWFGAAAAKCLLIRFGAIG